MSSNGYITARAYMSYAQIPLEDVAVVVTAQDGTAIAMRLTNRSGLTEPIPIPHRTGLKAKARRKTASSPLQM